jgi:hypothetical protein
MAVAVGLLPALVDAHFVLLEPAAWLQLDQRGDPQKLAPCGGSSSNPGTPSNLVTSYRGGQTIRLRVQETIFHPGHYRVALAVNSRAELPPDPEVVTRDTPKGPWSVSAAIQNPPQVPILADGLFAHTERPTAVFETDIVLPNINCEKCTLQVLQFMAEHGLNRDGDFSYHHCADLQISADLSKPLDTRWPGQGTR